MVDKSRVRRTIKGLQRIKTWQLIVLLILAGFISATFLRLNNIGMVERRTAVVNADKAGDAAITIQRLYDLQRYVSAHMNTDMNGGVYLQAQYDRDTQAAYDQAANASASTNNVYKQINDACKALYHSYTPYFQCVTDRLNNVPNGAETLPTISLPKANTYRYDYQSPLWSPDFAGWSMVVCGIIVLMIITRLISLGILRIVLHQHYKSI